MARSSPACLWPGRDSPKRPVSVAPETGATIRPSVHPPAAGAEGAGVLEGPGVLEGAGLLEGAEAEGAGAAALVAGPGVERFPPSSPPLSARRRSTTIRT